ncbi:hypothetical protein [Bacillus timonensis]|uniref:hypothetical protein n=1 Tax=Bacillus timonensis TaxID=1033734 RepID=UPI000288DA3B|nr:hypothetical protein [Bacillus timonensis]
MLRVGLTNKVHVLEEMDQLLYTLNKIDMQIQTEVNKHILDEGNQNITQMKKIENEIISIRRTYHNQTRKQPLKTDEEHSYHLTLSY